MALENFKRVQALKAERNRLAAELEERTTADVARILKNIGDDFVNFLSQEGFRVTRLKNAIGAIYGDTRLSLEFAPPQERFDGVLSQLSLSDSRNPENKWRLSIVGNSAGVVDTVAAPAASAQNGAVTLENMIEALRRRNDRFVPSDYQIRYQMVAIKDGAGQAGAVHGAASVSELLCAVLEEPLFNH